MLRAITLEHGPPRSVHHDRHTILRPPKGPPSMTSRREAADEPAAAGAARAWAPKPLPPSGPEPGAYRTAPGHAAGPAGARCAGPGSPEAAGQRLPAWLYRWLRCAFGQRAPGPASGPARRPCRSGPGLSLPPKGCACLRPTTPSPYPLLRGKDPAGLGQSRPLGQARVSACGCPRAICLSMRASAVSRILCWECARNLQPLRLRYDRFRRAVPVPGPSAGAERRAWLSGQSA